MNKTITSFIAILCIVCLSFNLNYSEAKTRKSRKAKETRTSSVYTSNSFPDVFNLALYENYIKNNGIKIEPSEKEDYSTSYRSSFLSKENVVFTFDKKQKKGNSPTALYIYIPINYYDEGVKIYENLQSLISQKYGIEYDSMCTGYDNYNLVFFWGHEILSERKNRIIGVDTKFSPNSSDIVDSEYVITIYLGPFKKSSNN